jgi:hypothetical protein
LNVAFCDQLSTTLAIHPFPAYFLLYFQAMLPCILTS